MNEQEISLFQSSQRLNFSDDASQECKVPFFSMEKEGLYRVCDTQTDRVCQPFSLERIVQTGSTAEQRMIFFENIYGEQRSVFFARKDVFGRSSKVAKALLDQGFSMEPGAKFIGWLNEYLLLAAPSKVCFLLDRPGLHEGVFVQPQGSIGRDSQKYIYHDEGQGHADISVQGSLSTWKEQVARLCAGNRFLILGIGLSLSGALLERVGHWNFGVHVAGGSRTGKTTWAMVGNSVWG